MVNGGEGGRGAKQLMCLLILYGILFKLDNRLPNLHKCSPAAGNIGSSVVAISLPAHYIKKVKEKKKFKCS